MKWLVDLPVQLQAAIIGAIVTFLGFILRDFVFKILHERRESQKTDFEIYKKYADPLATAATSLLWRLYEIFYEKGRGSYLIEARWEFEKYKKISTLYRLAGILGWIRAYKRELSFFHTHSKKQLVSIENAINGIESALADGPHVESTRLERLAFLWNINLPNDVKDKSEIAIIINNIIKPKLHSCNVKVADSLTKEDQNELCENICKALCSQLGIEHLPNQLIEEKREGAIQQIAIRESWLYRDWQAGIGDLMIKETSQGERRYEIVGYKEFEKMALSGTDEHTRWIDRLKDVIEDLDISGAGRFDARIEQLRNTMNSTAKLLKALASVKTKQNIVSQKTSEIVDTILLNSNKTNS